MHTHKYEPYEVFINQNPVIYLTTIICDLPEQRTENLNEVKNEQFASAVNQIANQRKLAT